MAKTRLQASAPVEIIYRHACGSDIKQMQLVRRLVKENVLSDPDRITDELVLTYITERGRGWVCEISGKVVGFAIADLTEKSVWALFVDPAFSQKGIGKQLHKLMIDWYFRQTMDPLTLGTEPNTRAHQFYLLHGWKNFGTEANGEVKLELTYSSWAHRHEEPMG